MRTNDNCPEAEKCLEIIHLVLDSEATEAQERYLSDHIEMCIKCLESYNFEKEIRVALKTKLEQKQVPSDLVNAIKASISADL